MTIRATRGFDFVSTANLNGIVRVGSSLTLSLLSGTSTRWNSGKALAFNSQGNSNQYVVIRGDGSDMTSAAVGVAFQGNIDGCGFGLWDGDNSAAQVTVTIYPSSSVARIWRGNGARSGATQLGTLAIPGAASAWHHYGLKVTGFGASQSVTLTIDGSAVSSITLTGQNTQGSSGVNYSDVVFVMGDTTPGWAQFACDDLYIGDLTGSAPDNDLLGDCRVYYGSPNGAGATTQFTPLASTNYSQVSETSPDDDTSYVYTSGVNNVDEYTTNLAVPTGATVFSVQASVYTRKDDAGAHTLSAHIRSGSSTFDGSAGTVTSGYAYVHGLTRVDPATSAAWTPSGANSAQPGAKLVS